MRDRGGEQCEREMALRFSLTFLLFYETVSPEFYTIIVVVNVFGHGNTSSNNEDVSGSNRVL